MTTDQERLRAAIDRVSVCIRRMPGTLTASAMTESYFEAVAPLLEEAERELAAVKNQLDQYDEFSTVYDPECTLPPLAGRLHGTLGELCDVVRSNKKCNDDMERDLLAERERREAAEKSSGKHFAARINQSDKIEQLESELSAERAKREAAEKELARQVEISMKTFDELEDRQSDLAAARAECERLKDNNQRLAAENGRLRSGTRVSFDLPSDAVRERLG